MLFWAQYVKQFFLQCFIRAKQYHLLAQYDNMLSVKVSTFLVDCRLVTHKYTSWLALLRGT